MAITRAQKAGAGITGTLGGAGAGALLGSTIFPGLGTIAGAIAGGLMGGTGSTLSSDKTYNQIAKERNQQRALMAARQNGTNPQSGFTQSGQPQNFWEGSPAGIETYNRYSPEQQQAMSMLLQQGLAGINTNDLDFSGIEGVARRDFQQKTIPSIAQRFANLGSLESSGFGNSLREGAVDLDTNLAGLRSGYNLQKQQLLQNMLGMGLAPQFDSISRDAEPGFKQNAANAFTQGLGTAVGNQLTPENAAAAYGHLKTGAGKLKDWWKSLGAKGATTATTTGAGFTNPAMSAYSAMKNLYGIQ